MPKSGLIFSGSMPLSCGLCEYKFVFGWWIMSSHSHNHSFPTLLGWINNPTHTQIMRRLSSLLSTIILTHLPGLFRQFSPSSTTPIITRTFLNTFIFIVKRSVV